MNICRINERGNAVIGWHISADRYVFDTHHCATADGWEQYDTEQDAWYFGVWVHAERKTIVTYAEGDFSRTLCPTKAHLAAELRSMAEFYGEPPPFAISYDTETGTRTEHYAPRPGA